jgi:hypothetical protein
VSDKGWKRIGGAACLVGAIVLWVTAANTAVADARRTVETMDRMVQAKQWEDEIAKMKTRISDDSQKLASVGKPAEEKAARRQVAEDKENLAAFEKMEAATGSPAVQREVLAQTDGDRWTVRGEYAGCGLLVVMGIGLMVSSFLRERVDADDGFDAEG